MRSVRLGAHEWRGIVTAVLALVVTGCEASPDGSGPSAAPSSASSTMPGLQASPVAISTDPETGLRRIEVADARAGDATAVAGAGVVVPVAGGLAALGPDGEVAIRVAEPRRVVALARGTDGTLWSLVEEAPTDPFTAGELRLVARVPPSLGEERSFPLGASANYDTARHALVAAGTSVYVVLHGQADPSRVVRLAADDGRVLASRSFGSVRGPQGGDYLHLAAFGDQLLVASSAGTVTALTVGLRRVWSRAACRVCADVATDGTGVWVVDADPAGVLGRVVTLDLAGRVVGGTKDIPVSSVAAGRGSAWIAGSPQTAGRAAFVLTEVDASGLVVRTLTGTERTTTPVLTSVEVAEGHVWAGWAESGVFLHLPLGR